MIQEEQSAIHFAFLSRLLLSPEEYSRVAFADLNPTAENGFTDLFALANSNHIVMRAFPMLQELAVAAGNQELAQWAENAIAKERARIEAALSSLQSIVSALHAVAPDVTVIKSLDHWPDLGSDLDLYTGADSSDVIRTMQQHFDARLADRSWGDRLAGKWNFLIPGLNESVEVHVGRLGQTGEQIAIAHSLPSRARIIEINEMQFPVPAAPERLMITTLQRMYRHFYIRLCDIVDTAELLTTQSVDFDYLRSAAQEAGILEGIATFLVVVSDYVKKYQGRELDLPVWIRSAARFGAAEVRFRRGFLRVPVVPHAVRLYASELGTLLRNRELEGTVRLSLLPCLATAAALEYKITGSDKGIW